MKFPDLHPVVVGSVTTATGLCALAKKSAAADAVEIRVDTLLAKKVTVETIESALKKRKLPALLTLRIPAEGGHRPWKIAERRELFLRLLPLVEAIDIELATASAMAPIIAEARRRGKTIVFSTHAIKSPASPAQIARWTGQFDPHSWTILKVAARIKSWHDLQQLAALLLNHPDWRIAAMGLGPYASQSRSVLTALGSCLVYGYLDRPAAPGQPSAFDMRKMARAARAFGK
ncbi:MAG: type I 3-dehydroquinate dehydratase [Methylacidiphilales bacterium]|nr:type I 3-dehydroquinate dehydratase [Candidatus Methylacidiphilales bacterium]